VGDVFNRTSLLFIPRITSAITESVEGGKLLNITVIGFDLINCSSIRLQALLFDTVEETNQSTSYRISEFVNQTEIIATVPPSLVDSLTEGQFLLIAMNFTGIDNKTYLSNTVEIARLDVQFHFTGWLIALVVFIGIDSIIVFVFITCLCYFYCSWRKAHPKSKKQSILADGDSTRLVSPPPAPPAVDPDNDAPTAAQQEEASTQRLAPARVDSTAALLGT
jgi:hypothetical protein